MNPGGSGDAAQTPTLEQDPVPMDAQGVSPGGASGGSTAPSKPKPKTSGTAGETPGGGGDLNLGK